MGKELHSGSSEFMVWDWLKREVRLLHTAEQGVELLQRDKQGSGVYGIQLDQDSIVFGAISLGEGAGSL